MTSKRRKPLFERGVRNDEAAIERPARDGRQARAVRPGDRRAGSIGSLAVCVAGRRGVPVAYMPGWRCGARPPARGLAHARKGGVVQTVKRRIAEFKGDNLTELAAAITC